MGAAEQEHSDFDRWCFSALSDVVGEVKPGLRARLPQLTVLLYRVCDGDHGSRFDIATDILRAAFEAGRASAKEKRMRYRKKATATIEAYRVKGDDFADAPDWLKTAFAHNICDVVGASSDGNGNQSVDVAIKTIDRGTVHAGVGDWIARGVKGELYPIRDDVFRETYEPVEA